MPQGIDTSNGSKSKDRIYVAESGLTRKNVLGYPASNLRNQPPFCTLSTGDHVYDIDADTKGNIIVPDGASGIKVYAPLSSGSICGKLVGTIKDRYGQAASAAALDAVKGTIVVANMDGGAEGVVTCTLKSRSCKPLVSPAMASVSETGGIRDNGGVAMDERGNCYASGVTSTVLEGGSTGYPTALWYYSRCAGKGKRITYAYGFLNQTSPSGLSIDKNDNLVAIEGSAASGNGNATVAVYTGCHTGMCHIVGGPFSSSRGLNVFGHLSAQGNRFVAANVTANTIDVYAYKSTEITAPSAYTTTLTYLYSFNQGLSCGSSSGSNLYEPACYSATFSPSSPE